ncbi:hypothetical protein Rumeso_02269 [Rubellimicrobium mesophilum DSM 19309]|uniref:Uncharacterized protein n=1 Tax=Rubellimicrobium mesophilum DSM 19309 TaxID=442562 RepID=A0A017HPS9_9RHOB|nr:hypothetical protein [Rubellimicrobium mesophilum]EYD76153.1 hypothetical protein Rumeso_02269 [Rubellimicrobium mesophilum DSM 19309]
MDISIFDTRQKAAAGVDIPLVIDGETIMGDDNQPVMFRIKGAADPTVMQALVNGVKQSAGGSPQQIEAGEMKLIRAAVIGWSDNWGIGNDAKGKPVKVTFSKETVEKVFGIPAIRHAIMQEIAKDSHFMNRASA